MVTESIVYMYINLSSPTYERKQESLHKRVYSSLVGKYNVFHNGKPGITSVISDSSSQDQDGRKYKEAYATARMFKYISSP